VGVDVVVAEGLGVAVSVGLGVLVGVVEGVAEAVGACVALHLVTPSTVGSQFIVPVNEQPDSNSENIPVAAAIPIFLFITSLFVIIITV
jgi:hypothetical protein